MVINYRQHHVHYVYGDAIHFSKLQVHKLKMDCFKRRIFSVLCRTHVKISQLVASLQTSRQQVMFARLVTTCQQVWNKAVNNL